MEENNNEVRMSALWSERIPVAIRRRRQACGGMLELRKSVDVSSIDSAGSAIGRLNHLRIIILQTSSTAAPPSAMPLSSGTGDSA
jgi:hypothetical protein